MTDNGKTPTAPPTVPKNMWDNNFAGQAPDGQVKEQASDGQVKEEDLLTSRKDVMTYVTNALLVSRTLQQREDGTYSNPVYDLAMQTASIIDIIFFYMDEVGAVIGPDGRAHFNAMEVMKWAAARKQAQEAAETSGGNA